MPNAKLNLDPIGIRVGMVVLGGGLVMFLLVAATAFFGDAVASSASTSEIAEFSKSIAPSNPKTYRAASLLKEQSFRDEDLKAALRDSETAVALSPNNFVLWQQLARLRERSGNILGAERALRKSLELAPRNASIQWALGNVLLREEKYDEGFRYIRTAVESDPRLAGPAASIAWDIFEGDKQKVRNAIGQSVQVRAALAVYLARLKRFDESYEFWNSIPPAQRSEDFASDGQKVLTSLLASKRFLFAVAVESDIQKGKNPLPKAEMVTNGGFEGDIPRDLGRTFDWRIAEGANPSIGISVEEKHSGERSLALFYSATSDKGFREISQTVAVRPGLKYNLSFRYKAEVKGDQTLLWVVADTINGNLIATSDPVESKSDWKTIETSFTVPEESEGVRIRLIKEKCPETSCPLVGTVWFDDIEIKKTIGNSD